MTVVSLLIKSSNIFPKSDKGRFSILRINMFIKSTHCPFIHYVPTFLFVLDIDSIFICIVVFYSLLFTQLKANGWVSSGLVLDFVLMFVKYLERLNKLK